FIPACHWVCRGAMIRLFSLFLGALLFAGCGNTNNSQSRTDCAFEKLDLSACDRAGLGAVQTEGIWNMDLAFDDGEHAHSPQRARALERLTCDVTTFDLRKRPGLLGRLAGSDLRSRLLKSIEVAEADTFAFNYDLATAPPMAEAGLNAFSEFMTQPDDYMNILQKTERNRL
ncbi:hypothetical protein B4Q13_18470, partial [Lacticaseibacillus rhamnosus]